VGLALASCGLDAAAATAKPVSGPHQVVDSRLTTTRPGAPTGAVYTGRYHAAHDPNGAPPYMRRMVAYPPRGFRYDTGVPARCGASDVELEAFGGSACPKASRIGGGTTQGVFLDRFRNTLPVEVFNNANEQILLVGSPGLATVARGRIHRSGAVEFASPTCFPAVQPCPVDNALQLGSSVRFARYTRSVNGRTRSYMTTAPRCPRGGEWRTPIRFWWADGSVDTVVTKQPCRGARGA
jgi:hypothetical protein